MKTNYDNLAIYLWQRWFGPRPNFTPFSRVSLREQNYWRGLAQIAEEEKSLEPPA